MRAREVEEKIREVEPEFVEKAVELLKKPLLVFGERNFVLFGGEYNDHEIIYTDCYYNQNPARHEESIDFFEDIKKGNRIRIIGEKIEIYNEAGLLRSVDKKQQWFMIDWD